MCKGETWEKENQVYDKAKRTISEIPHNLTHYVCLGEPEIKEEGNYTYVSLPINKEEKMSKTLRVHLYASTFISSDLANMFNTNDFRTAEDVKTEYLARN